MLKDESAKKTISILPIKEPGEPAVISIQISQAKSSLCYHSEISLRVVCYSLYVPYFCLGTEFLKTASSIKRRWCICVI